MECSDINDGFDRFESEPEENIIELWGIYDKIFDSENNDNEVKNKENVQEFSESEFENILNLQDVFRCFQILMKVINNYRKRDQLQKNRRITLHNINKDISGLHRICQKMKGKVNSIFFLLMDHYMFKPIISCTELEASRNFGKKWILTKIKKEAFIEILKWEPNFFSNIMKPENELGKKIKDISSDNSRKFMNTPFKSLQEEKHQRSEDHDI
ncbi:LOW QUALITY PROTEIN: piggyBac transposable element-derived protein 4-like [Vespula squamosa]|uniref:PiggyBac transposable element-derived protein 4-like n=1 Tax=Vespula squamosa TaxID=30214 RepID=A0ABD2A157_VESSQ